MPKNRYKEVKLIKKQGKTRKFFKIMSYMFVVLGLGFLFSEVIGSVFYGTSTMVFTSSDSITFKRDSLYALSLGEYATLAEAEEVANVAGSWGAGAYIANLENKYQVIGCVYSSNEDGEKVKQNLQTTNYNAKTIELKFNKIKFSISDIAKDNKEIIKNNFDIFNKTYKSLYDITMKVDKGEVTHIVASGQVNTLKSDVRVNRLKLANLANEYNNEVLIKLNDALIKLEEGLDVCVNQLLSNTYINQAVKYCLCNCVFLQHNLLNNL